MRLRRGAGTLTQGGPADLLVVGDTGQTPASRLLRLRTGDMEMVFVRGRVKLASPAYVERLPPEVRRCLHPVCIGGRQKRQVFVAVNVPRLFGQVESILGPVVLAHKRMLRTP
jgi:hypothetical protein